MKFCSPLVLIAAFLIPGISSGQTGFPEDNITIEEVAAHMNFLAADELQGRRTGSAGITIASRYIASHFAALGLEYVPGMDSWYQPVQYEEVVPPASGSITYGDASWEHGKDMLFLRSTVVEDPKAKFVFAGYGLKTDSTNDYDGLNVKGKVVVTFLGLPGEENPNVVFSSLEDKIEWAKEEGAIGLIELYRLRFPWGFVQRYFGTPRIRLADEEEDDGQPFFYGWVRDDDGETGAMMQEAGKGKMAISSSGSQNKRFSSPNVLAYLPGTDPELRDQVVILSAHYDHVGVGEQGGGRFTEEDSIFNGARDNAFGTVSVLAAARAFAANPPKRSVIFMTFSGEEIGLLGSQYYAEHPAYPLEKTVFNLNTDGAGYDDTSAVSILGYGRMSIDPQLDEGAGTFGLNIIANPAPEQGLFDRSDNVSFARKGVPALTYSPGITSFNREISKYYHQVTDNPETINMAYLRTFCQSFAFTARLITNLAEVPAWNEGDKYEEAGKELYGSP